MTPQQKAMMSGNWANSQPPPRRNYNAPTVGAQGMGPQPRPVQSVYPWYVEPWLNYDQQSSGYIPDVPTYQDFQQSQPPSYVPLPGRYIQDSSEIRPNEVPMDGRVVYFPTKDGTTIIAKYWDQSGTLRDISYVPQIAPEEVAAVEGNKPSYPTVQDIDAVITPKIEFLNNRLQAIEAHLSGIQAGTLPARGNQKPKKEEP